VDTPLWVTVLASALTALGAYVAGVRPARIAARQAEADRDLARLERDDHREQWLIERIERATRLVSNILDEVAQEELGDELRDLRAAYQRTGVLPDVDSIVMEGDHDGKDDGVQEGDHVEAEDPRDSSAG
jgi:hypothetical protein